MTILHHAVLQGRKSAVELLLNSNKTISLEEKGEDNMTLLHVAAIFKENDRIRPFTTIDSLAIIIRRMSYEKIRS